MAGTKIIRVHQSDRFDELLNIFRDAEAEDIIFIIPKGTKFASKAAYFEILKEESQEAGKNISIMSPDPKITELAAICNFTVLEDGREGYNRRSADLASAAGDILDNGDTENEDDRIPDEADDEEEDQTAGAGGPTGAEGQDNDGTESDENEIDIGEDGEETETAGYNIQSAYDVELASARLPSSRKKASVSAGEGKIIKDIMGPEADTEVKVRGRRAETKEMPVDIKKEVIDVPEEELSKDAQDMLENLYNEKDESSKENKTEKDSGGEVEISSLWAKDRKRKRDASLRGFISKLASRKTITFGVAAFVILAAVLYISLGSAKIIIRPNQQDLNFSMNITASVNEDKMDFNLKKIPGQRFTVEKSKSEVFPVTGEQEVAQKARGEIIVYNTTTAPQRLVATTRFRSPDGLVFRIPNSIVIPGGSTVDGEFKPGTVKAVVFADKPGERYNIQPARFTIPGFEGTPRYKQFYAVSEKPMTGGIIGPASTVTSEDYNNAQTKLTRELRDEILSSIKEQAKGLVVLDSIAISMDEPKSMVGIGEAAEELKLSVSGKADIIAFREADVISLIKQYVEHAGDLVILEETIELEYKSPKISGDNNQLLFKINVKGKAASRIDKDALIHEIAGMNETAVTEYFQGKENIEKARVILSPFWLRSIPSNPDDITIEIDTSAQK